MFGLNEASAKSQNNDSPKRVQRSGYLSRFARIEMDQRLSEIPVDFFRQLFDFVSELVWAVTPDGRRLLFMNRAALAVYGDAQQNLDLRDFLWLGAIHPEDRVIVTEQLQKIESQGGEFESEFRVLNKAGKECWLHARFRRFPGTVETPGYIGVLANDITRRIWAEQKLDEAHAIYESLVQSIPIKVFRKNRQGRLVFCNETYRASLGRSLDELIGKTDEDLFSSELGKKYREDDLAVMASGEPLHKIEEHPGERGSTAYVEVIKVPVKDARGNRVGIQGIFWDVTERITAQQKLERAKALAESASLAKSEFLASVSHEIRTPLNGVIGTAELLLDTAKDRGQREYLEIILQSGETLLDLINDLLDFSKIEAGRLELEPHPVELDELLLDTLRTHSTRALGKRIELVADIDLPFPFWVIVDGPRLRQVISNLIGNAIKFTRQGEVVLEVVPKSISADVARLRFEVRDTGIGIPAEKRGTIFEKFEQADKSTSREFGGTGLGLAITSKIVEMMGAQIEVDSEVGKGSRFFFVLDLPLDRESRPRRNEVDLEQRRALVWSPRASTAKVLSRWIKNWNGQVVVTSDREAFSQQLKQASDGPDFVIVDQGFDSRLGALVRLVRNTEWNVELPLIVLTQRPRGRRETDHSGVRRLIKPVRPSDLAQILHEVFDKDRFENVPANQLVRENSERSLRILLAEDNLINQRLARAILERLGHQVSVANDGQEAISRATTEAFDIVLMDVQMPKIDGFEATREIRQKVPRDRLPIVALSAHTVQGFREQCLAAGMDDYLAKPIRRKSLRDVLQRLAGIAVPWIPVSDVRQVNVIDWEHALETVGGDRELLTELIGVFKTEHGATLAQINAALDESDWVGLQRLAHGFKGALEYLGARQAAGIAWQIEESCKSPDEGIKSTLNRLNQAVKDLTLELEKFKT